MSWQPIETAPRDGSSILGWWKKSQIMSVIFWDDAWIPGDDSNIVSISPPSHWLEIPKPPGWKK